MDNKGIKLQLLGISIMLISPTFLTLGLDVDDQNIFLGIFSFGFLISIIGFFKK